MTLWDKGEMTFKYLFKHYLWDVLPIKKYDDIYIIREKMKIFSMRGGRVEVKGGASRCTLIFDDFVIKIPYGKIDDNYYESRMYQKACYEGYEHLFAECHTRRVYGINILIMKRVYGIGSDKRYLENTGYLAPDEKVWLEQHVADLHCGNYGFDEYGNPIIADYAMTREEEDKYAELCQEEQVAIL